METFFQSLPNSFIGWAGVLTFFVVGAVAFYGLWDKTSRDRRKDGNASEDRLIDLLKKTVDELERKMNKQTIDIEELSKKITHLEKENETLVKVLQGRDEQTQTFYKQAVESMKVAAETHDVVSTLAKNIEVTNTNTTKLIELMGKHLDHMDNINNKKG